MNSPTNPCLHCGACCAFFRASFYYREADDHSPDGVPVELTQDLTPFRRVMRGTNQANPRCLALQGSIGLSVACSIHPRRSTVCRGFRPSYDDGITPNEDCERARAAHGLPPLTPTDWEPTPEDDLRPAA